MRKCLACRSANVALVDRALSLGETVASVARWSGLPPASVKRHRAMGHVVAPGPVAARKPPVHDPAAGVQQPVTDSLGDLASLKAELNSMMAGATPSQKVMIVAEMRRVMEAEAKAAGPVQPDKITLADIEGYFELETALFDALEPFPLARQAMAKVLRDRLARTRESAPDERGG